MSDGVDRTIANMGGAAALPRRNGELAFEAPWQGRAFGMVLALYHQGLYPWDEFRDRLIAEIGAGGDDTASEDPGALYYRQWLASFEKLLVEKGIVSGDELDERAREFSTGTRDEVF